ncbi:MAG: hypothetical protein JNJ83_18315 [Verrucomicrobiaceae bacterium]|nr:hypothetical protein [Verrucomicrobiaceae bacterium]
MNTHRIATILTLAASLLTAPGVIASGRNIPGGGGARRNTPQPTPDPGPNATQRRAAGPVPVVPPAPNSPRNQVPLALPPPGTRLPAPIARGSGPPIRNNNAGGGSSPPPSPGRNNIPAGFGPNPVNPNGPPVRLPPPLPGALNNGNRPPKPPRPNLPNRGTQSAPASPRQPNIVYEQLPPSPIQYSSLPTAAVNSPQAGSSTFLNNLRDTQTGQQIKVWGNSAAGVGGPIGNNVAGNIRLPRNAAAPTPEVIVNGRPVPQFTTPAQRSASAPNSPRNNGTRPNAPSAPRQTNFRIPTQQEYQELKQHQPIPPPPSPRN